MNLGEYMVERTDDVNRQVEEFVQSKVPNEMMAMAAVMLTGGKRLRGTMAVLCCEAIGGDLENINTWGFAYDAATAVELAHSASLVKDDVMDEDDVRRGSPAFWKIFGFKAALLAPDVFIPHAIHTLFAKHGGAAVGVIINAWQKTARGQLLDMPLPQIDLPLPFHFPGLPERIQISLPMVSNASATYEEIIGLKTAPLFEAACDLGIRAAKQDHKVAVGQVYGRNCGLAFQVFDDYADLAQAVGKPWNEASNGPLPLSMVALQRELGGGDVITDEDCAGTLMIGEKYLRDAIQAAALFPDTEFRPLLEELPQHCCNALLTEAGVAQ